MQIALPRPSLVLLVGVSGSGKSTFARTHFRPTEILSSDACRALLSDDEADQSATTDAFALLRWIAAKRLARGKLAVIDATNVQEWARAQFVELAREANVPVVAIVFDLPDAIARERNLSRDRSVPGEVIEQQAQDLRDHLATLPNEGFREVFVLRTPEEVRDVQVVISDSASG